MAIYTLTTEERHLYRGSGYVIAQFNPSKLVDIFYIEQVAVSDITDVQASVNEMLKATTNYINNAEHKTIIAMASCHQLIELGDTANAMDLARLANRLTESLQETLND